MRAAEILALVYFVVVGGAALALLRRRAGAPIALGWAAAGVVVTATASVAPTVLRDWWLIVALPLAYWAPARLAGTANERVERWLQSIDDRLGLSRLDPAGHGLLEFAYFLVYPMVPAGLLAITFSNPGMAAEFWLVLFAAVLPCYGLLPLLPTRPPRAFLLPHRQPAAPHSSSGAPTSGSSRRSAIRGTHCRAATPPVPRLLP